MSTQTAALPDGTKLTKPASGEKVSLSVINTNTDNIANNIIALNSQIGYTEDGSFNSASSLATLLNNALANSSNKRKLLRFGCNGSFDSFYRGVSYFVDLKVSSASYSSCIMQGVGYDSLIVGTLSNGSWSFKEQMAYEVETPASFDTDNLVSVVGLRRSNTVQVNATFKAGLAASWHNSITTGLSVRFRPATAVYGCHRVNASADLSKDIIAILNTDGSIQMLNGAAFNGDVPFSFTFVTAS